MALVLISADAQAQFESVPKAIKARVEKIFRRLERWPAVSGVKPLSGVLAGHYRIRTGDYRVQFRITPGAEDRDPRQVDLVTIEKIGHRDGFYEE